MTPIGADMEVKTVQGYADRGKVARLIRQGWAIAAVAPVQLGGFTLKQSIFTMVRPKS